MSQPFLLYLLIKTYIYIKQMSGDANMKLRRQIRKVIKEVFRTDTKQGNLARRASIRARSGKFDDEMLKNAAELDHTGQRQMSDVITDTLTDYNERDHVIYADDHDELKNFDIKKELVIQKATRKFLSAVSNLESKGAEPDTLVGLTFDEGGWYHPLITGTVKDPFSKVPGPKGSHTPYTSSKLQIAIDLWYGAMISMNEMEYMANSEPNIEPMKPSSQSEIEVPYISIFRFDY
jgi:hypothetical protein